MSTGYRLDHNHLPINLQQIFVLKNPKVISW